MNKLLKKSSIMLTAVGLVIAGGVGAALVSYLANDVVVTNTVSSPVLMSVNEGRNGASTGNVSLTINSFGADSYHYTTVTENQANNSVTGYAVTVVDQIAGGNLTGREFTKVEIEYKAFSPATAEITDYIFVVMADGTLKQLKNNTWNHPRLVTTVCQFITNPSECATTDDAVSTTIAGGTTDWVVTYFTLNQATVGTYTIKGQYVDDLALYAVEEYAK
jgi:hypothetical protein